MNAAVSRGVENKTARKFIAFIDEFRKLNTEMQAQQISLFLNIVAQPDLTVTEYGQRAGLTAGGPLARNMEALTETKKVNKGGQITFEPGLNLIKTYEDPMDRRFKRAKPTTRGTQVYNTLIQLLGS
jgi:hypothetical protein